MATALRVDPYRSFKFRVEIDGIQTAAFSEATIPSQETKSVDYREGTDPSHSRKLATTNSFGNLTLKKGLSDSMELYNWYKMVQDGGVDEARKTISVVLLDDKGNDKARWDIVEAWPVKYESSGFNAGGTDVMIETLEITNEGIRRVS